MTDFDAIDFFRDHDVHRRPVPVLRAPPRRSARCSASRTTTS